MKKNVFHSNHLTENKTETMFAIKFANVTKYNNFAVVNWK